MRLIFGEDQCTYRIDLESVMVSCRDNNFLLNSPKTLELIVDFRKKGRLISHYSLTGSVWRRFPFPGFWESTSRRTWPVVLTQLRWWIRHSKDFISWVWSNNIHLKLLVSLYRCSIERLLTYRLCVWFSSCTAAQSTSAGYQRCPEKSQFALSGETSQYPLWPITHISRSFKCCHQADNTGQ